VYIFFVSISLLGTASGIAVVPILLEMV